MNSANPRLTMLTIDEAARRFPGLTAYRIRLLVKSGALPYICAGRKYLICEQAIRNYILQNAVYSDSITAQDTPRR
jgi:hypothetical protein